MSPSDELRCFRQLLLQIQGATVVADDPKVRWVDVRLHRDDWAALQHLILKVDPHHG